MWFKIKNKKNKITKLKVFELYYYSVTPTKLPTKIPYPNWY